MSAESQLLAIAIGALILAALVTWLLSSASDNETSHFEGTGYGGNIELRPVSRRRARFVGLFVVFFALLLTATIYVQSRLSPAKTGAEGTESKASQNKESRASFCRFGSLNQCESFNAAYDSLYQDGISACREDMSMLEKLLGANRYPLPCWVKKVDETNTRLFGKSWTSLKSKLGEVTQAAENANTAAERRAVFIEAKSIAHDFLSESVPTVLIPLALDGLQRMKSEVQKELKSEPSNPLHPARVEYLQMNIEGLQQMAKQTGPYSPFWTIPVLREELGYTLPDSISNLPLYELKD